MKILVLIGSPKGKGNTYKLAKEVEKEIIKLDKNMEFEYLMLKDINLQTCRGCFQCLEKGEQFCPIKDDRDEIEAKMLEADGVIFATPVYVYNVTWIMKNFLDRFAYICHRPRFHGKHAMVIVSTGAVGLSFVTKLLSFEIGTWGFSVAQKLGAICPTGKLEEGYQKKLLKNIEKNIIKSSRNFYNSLMGNNIEKPGLINFISFNLQKHAFLKAEKELADYKYWESKGWLKNNTEYYYPLKANYIKKFISRTIVKLLSMGLSH